MTRVVVAVLVVLALTAPALAPPVTAQPAPARDGCQEDLPSLYVRVSPAVVSITATSINPYRLAERVSRSAGSGFLIDGRGVLLTNAHVVFERQSIVVTLDDGTRLPARLIGADPIFDVAVVQIPPLGDGPLPTVKLADSDRVRVGQEVVAIGNPLGLEQTLTRGVVSAVNRILPETPFSLLEPLIQTDAPINPGNSGGPLLDRCGEVIGITTAIMPDAQNLGFAVPSNVVKAILPSLVANGRVIRPWIGFHGQLVGPDLQKLLRPPMVEGLLVEVVEPGSPAATAGVRGGSLEVVVDGRSLLLGGDIVTEVNGIKVTAVEELARAMRALTVGSRVRLSLFRGGSTQTVEYTLPERPLLPSDVMGSRSAWGVGAPVTPDGRPRRPGR